MFPLLELPLPIVQDIVKLLCPHCYPAPLLGPDRCWGTYCHDACPNGPKDAESIATLESLCLTNRLLNYIATPLLYHWPFYSHGAEHQLAVAHTIWELRPDLAQHVKSVHLYVSEFHEDGLSEEDRTLARKVAGQLEAVVDLEHNQTIDFLGLIAGSCTNMEELCVIAHSSENSPVPFSGPGSLPKLNKLIVSHWDTEFGFDLSPMKDLFNAAPNLTSLHVWSMVGIGPDMNMQNIKEIELINSVLQTDALELLLEQCPNLERFIYHVGGGCVTDEGSPTVREMQDMIAYAAPGLKSLTLYVGDSFFDEATEDDMLRSLKSMRRLEELKLDEECVVPDRNLSRPQWTQQPDGTMARHLLEAQVLGPEVLVDLFPSSIRTLEIGQTGECGVRSLVPTILMLSKVCKKEFPRLEVVTFPGLDVEVDGEREARELFERNGVTFCV